MQISTKPEALDAIDREIVRLKIEQEALKKETDRGLEGSPQEAREGARSARAEVGRADQPLEERKGQAVGRAETQDRARPAARGTRQCATSRRVSEAPASSPMAAFRSSRRKLKDVEAAEGKGAMVEEAVTADHVAQVVSRWTGVPVDRMLEGEREKLLHMEESLSKRVIGQEEAVKAVSTAVRRARAGLQDPQSADRIVHVPGTDRRRQDRAHQGAGRVPVRRRDRAHPHRHVGIHGEALGGAADRRAAGLRRL